MFCKTTLGNLFGIDPRSLALFRMAIGSLLLADLAIRATDLSVMYTDVGMFPRAVICRHYTSFWNWSFHFGSGTWAYQAVLFCVAAVLALAMMIGFQTRFAVIGSWLLLVSLHNRVPPILSGADNLLRMLVFWAMFLPLERMWSVDWWLGRRRGSVLMDGDETPVLSVASGAILLQIALMYLISAIFKSNSDWLHGKAIAGTLSHDFYVTPIGAYLLNFPRLLTGMTVGVLALEWLAPVLLFFPKFTPWLRIGMIAALVAMHVGIGICLAVDLFSPVALAGLALFLPAQFWNRVRPAHVSGPATSVMPSAVATSPVHEHPRLFYFAQAICVLFVIYLFVFNMNSLTSRSSSQFAREQWDFLATACGFGQKWNMFETIPSKDGWYIARAKLTDGSEVDLLQQGAAVDWQRPKFPAGEYPNYRWRKIFREMAYNDELGYQVFRAPVAEFLCRSWDAQQKTANRQIIEFDFIYCMEESRTSNSPTREIVAEQLLHLDFRGS